MVDPLSVALVLVILAGAIYLFVTERFPLDLVSMMVLGALLLVGLLGTSTGVLDPEHWITPREGVSGFSNPAVITVAAMFVLSAGLEKTGVVRSMGRALILVGDRRPLLLVTLMLIAAAASSFINNTATVAILLPVVLTLAARRNISPSLLLIPLSFASQFGGTCTVIGTSTNLLVSSISAGAGTREEGLGAFTMFEMGQMGLILTAAGTLYLLIVGRFLLPARRGADFTEAYQLGEYLTELRVKEGSRLVGETLSESVFVERHGARLLEVLRGGQFYQPTHVAVRVDDVLLVRGKVQDLMDLKTKYGLEIQQESELRDGTASGDHLTLAEAVVAPHAAVVGHSLAELDLRTRYHTVVLAIQRRGHTVQEKMGALRLRFGDALLVMGRPDDIALLRSDPSFIVLKDVHEPTLRRHKMPLAVGILAGVVGLAALEIMPIVVSAILGCIALVATRCLRMEEAYQAIDWKVVFLLAGVLPLGLTLEKSGAAELLAVQTVALAGSLGPLAMLAVIYLLTAILTEFISNNAAAVLIAPLAISLAQQLDASPRPFLMAVAFAASTAFATPVGYQTNAMIYNPGGYRFTDFARVGLPLIALFWGLSIYFIPRIWPF